MSNAVSEQLTNGDRIIAEMSSVSSLAMTWEDENGTYHDSGWHQSWPDGWRDSHS